MDIRNFFGSPKGSSNKKKTKTTNKSSSSSATATAKATAASSSKKKENEETKRKTVTSKSTTTRPSKTKPDTVNRSTSSTSNQYSKDLKKSTISKSTTTTKTTTKPKPKPKLKPPTKRKQHKNDFMDDDDDNYDDDFMDDVEIETNDHENIKKKKIKTKTSNPKLKSKNNINDDDDGDDGDDDDDFMSGEGDDDVKTSHKSHKSKPKRAVQKRKKNYFDEDDFDDDDDNDNDNDGDYKADLIDLDDDHDDDHDDDFEAPRKKKVRSTTSSASSSSTKKRTTTTTKKSSLSKSKQAKTKTKPKTKPKPKPEKFLTKPKMSISSYSHDDIQSNNKLLFTNITFVITGVLPSISRDDMIDYIKILGGRVTTAVSSKTNYLVIGTELEDGREVQDGSKYKKAVELGDESISILKGEGEVYALAQLLDGNGNGDGNGDGAGVSGGRIAKGCDDKKVEEKKKPSAVVSNPYAKKSTVTNPYAKSTVKNPYAKSTTSAVRNPYAKGPSSSPSISLSQSSSQSLSQSLSQSSSSTMGGGRASLNDANALWADKYAPSSTRMILGNGTSVKKLQNWLLRWEDNFVKPPPAGGKRRFNPKTGPFKAALLSGPPGIGKTTTAVLVAKEANRQVLELNASDTRSKKSLETNLGDVTGSHVLSFNNNKKGSHGATKATKRCVIMDEVDGMGAGDRSGMSELIKMIKNSLVPIICICNDRQSQKIKSLVPHCLDLKYSRPQKSVIAKRAVEVGLAEGMNIEQNAALAVVESCGNDIRQVLNCLQMWSCKKSASNMTYKEYKERDNLVNKDEILRVSMFDATRLIVEGRRGLSAGSDPKIENASLYKRTDAFFVDYSLMGLMVHQNYLRVSNQSKNADLDAELESMKELYEGMKSMSDFAVAEESVRKEQNWSMLPLCSVLAVKTGYHVGGESGGMLRGYPEFSGWLGKNSSRGKKTRLIQELAHHMNYKISADNTELRLGYLPAMRKRLSDLLLTKDNRRITEAIEFMDEYGLDRDDVFENMDEFLMIKEKVKKFSDLESTSKAAFTREYNKGIHKSQALVDEQGVSTKKRKAVKDIEYDEEDENGFDEDDDVEVDVEELAKAFQKKKKSTAAKRGKKPKK